MLTIPFLGSTWTGLWHKHVHDGLGKNEHVCLSCDSLNYKLIYLYFNLWFHAQTANVLRTGGQWLKYSADLVSQGGTFWFGALLEHCVLLIVA